MRPPPPAEICNQNGTGVHAWRVRSSVSVETGAGRFSPWLQLARRGFSHLADLTPCGSHVPGVWRPGYSSQRSPRDRINRHSDLTPCESLGLGVWRSSVSAETTEGRFSPPATPCGSHVPGVSRPGYSLQRSPRDRTNRQSDYDTLRESRAWHVVTWLQLEDITQGPHELTFWFDTLQESFHWKRRGPGYSWQAVVFLTEGI